MSAKPLFQAWLRRFEKSVSPRGAKTRAAEALARHSGTTTESARVTIHRILDGTEPQAETVLFLSRWMEKHPSGRSATGKTVKNFPRGGT